MDFLHYLRGVGRWCHIYLDELSEICPSFTSGKVFKKIGVFSVDLKEVCKCMLNGHANSQALPDIDHRVRTKIMVKIFLPGARSDKHSRGEQTAIAVDTKQSRVIKASEEECWECREVNDRQLVVLEKQLNKLEVYSKLLLVLSKYYPELREISEELSNRLSNINKLYDEFNTDILQPYEPPICNILVPLFFAMELMGFAAAIRYQLALYFGNDFSVMIWYSIMIALMSITLFLWKMTEVFDCVPSV